MEQPAEPASVRAPAEVGMGVDGARHRLAEAVLSTEREEPAQQAGQGYLIDGHSPTANVPDAWIRIGENGLMHVRKARARISSIGVDDLFDAKLRRSRHDAITRRTAAMIRSGLGRAWGRTLPLGVGTGAVPTRMTGAWRRVGAASATAATISAPRPPVTQASWTVTSRPVRWTDSTTVAVSSG